MSSPEVQYKQFFVGEHCDFGCEPSEMLGSDRQATLHRKYGFLKA